ncbi:HAD family phosphatase [uncultured Umboniibacter sp.]|uniref:HAD family hydrolase n=1 Tax=uncultured Umboniibacter sp. TaxID=1798917 RepID=UPI002616245E|nr:HAD family phosphatase [uncultured Umboniibacter sp.]
MQNIDLVIFDCDGVLVDTERVANNVLHQHLSRYEWPLDLKDTERFFRGRSLSERLREAINQYRLDLPTHFLETMQRETFEQFRTTNLSFPGCDKVVRRLQSSPTKMCIASSGSHEKMSLTLGQTHLLNYFPVRFSSHDVARSKPAPDLFLKASDYFNTHPKQCLVIEDSEAGLVAADAAGMNSIGLHTQLTQAEQHRFPNTLFFSDHTELLAWMERH